MYLCVCARAQYRKDMVDCIGGVSVLYVKLEMLWTLTYQNGFG